MCRLNVFSCVILPSSITSMCFLRISNLGVDFKVTQIKSGRIKCSINLFKIWYHAWMWNSFIIKFYLYYSYWPLFWFTLSLMLVCKLNIVDISYTQSGKSFFYHRAFISFPQDCFQQLPLNNSVIDRYHYVRSIIKYSIVWQDEIVLPITFPYKVSRIVIRVDSLEDILANSFGIEQKKTKQQRKKCSCHMVTRANSMKKLLYLKNRIFYAKLRQLFNGEPSIFLLMIL